MDITLSTDGWSITEPLGDRGHRGSQFPLHLPLISRRLPSQGLQGFDRGKPGPEVLGGKRPAAGIPQVIIDVSRVDRVPPAFFVDPLKQLLARDIGAAPHNPGKRRIADTHTLGNATLASKLKSQLVPANTHMPVTQRGQAERPVGAGVFLVANPDQRKFQQPDYSRQHSRAWQPGLAQVLGNSSADARKTASELEHTIKLCGITVSAPTRVIPVLFAPARVTPGRLQMAARIAADPDVTIGRRYGETTDACEQRRIRHFCAVRVDIGETASAGRPADPGAAIARECEIDRILRVP